MSTADRPREPEPHTRPMSSAAVRPATPRWASRSLGRSASGSSRMARPRPAGMNDPSSGMRSTAVPPGGTFRGGSGVPGVRTTGARRFPPPSGPQRTPRSLSVTPHRRLNRGFTEAHHAGAGRPRTERRPLRDALHRAAGRLADDEEDPVEGRMQPERRPDRPAPNEEPAEHERDRDPRTERDDRLSGTPPRPRSRRSSARARRRRRGPPGRPPVALRTP